MFSTKEGVTQRIGALGDTAMWYHKTNGDSNKVIYPTDFPELSCCRAARHGGRCAQSNVPAVLGPKLGFA
jgi:hypothetical protein